jgi:hypothetical protein
LLTTLTLHERYSHSASSQQQGTASATAAPAAPVTGGAVEPAKPERVQERASSARDTSQPLESGVDYSSPETPAPEVPDPIKDSDLAASQVLDASAPPVPVEAPSYFPEASSQPVSFSPPPSAPAKDRSEAPASDSPAKTAPSPASPRNTGPFLLRGAGATFPNPIYQRWFNEYHIQHPEVTIDYQSVGSGAGIRELQDGRIDFGASDGPMSDEQLSRTPFRTDSHPNRARRSCAHLQSSRRAGRTAVPA